MKIYGKKIIENSYKQIIGSLGDFVDQKGVKDTPKRVANAYEELLSGYTADIEKIIKELSTLNKTFVITVGEKGAICVNKKDVFRTSSEKINKVIDLTGAGDLFAAGFIHGFINKMGFEKSLRLGAKSSAKIIQILGARPQEKLSNLI